MGEYNEHGIGGTPADFNPEAGEFAPTWELLGRMPDPRPSAGFGDRLNARLRAELAARAVARRAADRPAAWSFRLWAKGVAAAAAVAAAAWIGTGFLSAPADDPTPTPIAQTPTETVVAASPATAGAPDLAAVESVPADVVAAVDGLMEIRIETENLEQGISAIAQGPTMTAASLAEQFPFLDSTFEQTLSGL